MYRWVVFISLAFIGGCQTTPQFRTITQESYKLILADAKLGKQQKASITVEELGELDKVIQPVKVQKCVNGQLIVRSQQYTDRKTKKTYTKNIPVMETIDPLKVIYARRMKITNDKEHVLRLGRLDYVLVDAAGNDYEGLTRDLLYQHIMAGRPCSSTNTIIRALDSLKLLGQNTRIRPGRSEELLVAFPAVDKRVLGDWVLELNDFPVATNEAGHVTRVTRFEFPLVVESYRTAIKYRKDNLFSQWQEIDRQTEKR